MLGHRYGEKEETVMEHCRNAAKEAERLGEPVQIKELARLCALIHDLGKDNHMFDSYIREVTKEDGVWTRGKLNHSSAGGKWIYERYANTELPVPITATLVAWTVFSHHGIINMVSADGEDKFEQRLHPIEDIYYEESKENFERECTENIDELFEHSKQEVANVIERYRGKEGAWFYIGMFFRLSLSILLESDRRSTAIFMGSKVADDYIDTAGLWERMRENIRQYVDKLPKDGALNRLRTEIGEQCAAKGSVKEGIYTLQIPTGGGKTIASMQFAIEHAKEHKKQRIFYVAPFKSILVQNAQVYRTIFDDKEAIFEHHSDVIAEEDEQDTRRALAESWRSPVILTTMVQFLNTLFSGKTQCIRRMNALTNSIIILDEIQSIPVRCIHLFNQAMNFLKDYGATVVLCSATQPLLGNVPRPIRIDATLIESAEEEFAPFRRTQIYDRREIKTAAQIAEFAGKLMEAQNSGIIIVNTKRAAGDIFYRLSEQQLQDIKLIYLSTFLCPQHRLERLEEFKEALNNGQKVICISTPLIEAGVDISAEWVIRSITGLDSIIQAAGRCNRNAKEKTGNVYLVKCEEENLDQLQDIKEGQSATEKLLDDEKELGEERQRDLSSIEVLDSFYRTYYYSRRSEMDYLLPKGKGNLYEWLSGNETGRRELKKKNKSVLFAQAFRDAGEHFKVIDDNTVGVLVPYKEGRQYIDEINSTYDFDKLRSLLRQSQRYTVNFYKGNPGKKRDSLFDELLSNHVIQRFDTCEGYYLTPGYYDEKTGVKLDGSMETLLF